MEFTTSAQFHVLMNTILKENGAGQALQLFHIAAYFAPENIRPGMFSNIFSNLEEWSAAVSLLQKFSLVQSHSENEISFKKEVQLRVRNFFKELKVAKWVLRKAIEVIISMKSFNSKDLCHAMAALSFAKEYSELQEESTHLTTIVISKLNDMQRSLEAYELGSNALDSLKNTLGEYHPRLLEIQYHMGGSLIIQNRKNEAFDFLLSLYKKESEVNGTGVINRTLTTLTQLMMHREISGLAKFVMVTDPSLSMSSKVEARVRQIAFGRLPINKTKDNFILERWLVYAYFLCQFNAYTKALEVLENVVKRRKEILDPNDDDICEAQRALAWGLVKVNKFQKSFELLKNIYDKRSKNLGEMNEKTLIIKFEIAVVFQAQGDYSTALPLIEEVADKFKSSLGENSSLYMQARCRVGLCCFNLGEYDKAYEICTALHQQQIKVFGEKHQETLICKRNIADILLKQNKTKEALKIFEELFEECTEVYTPFHDEMFQLALNIGNLQHLERIKQPKLEPMHTLSMVGNLEKLKSLIETGVQVNGKESDGKTPLHYAAQFGHVEIAKLLLEKGAKYNISNDAGNTPLQVTETHSVRKLLLAIKGLFDGAKVGNGENVLQHITEESWIVNIVDKDGFTALHWASVGGHCSVVKLLLEFGADASLVSDKGNSSLHLAASKGHLGIVELLLQFVGGDKVHDFINDKTKTGCNTSLHVAAERGFLDVVKTLLSNGAVYSMQNKCGKTPLDVAKEFNCLNLLKLVKGLFQDAEEGNSDILYKLLDVNPSDLFVLRKVRNSDKRTLLQVATDAKHNDLARRLLRVFNINNEN